MGVSAVKRSVSFSRNALKRWLQASSK